MLFRRILFLSLVLVLLSVGSSFAQTFGVEVGANINMAKLGGVEGESVDTGSKTGLLAGIFVAAPVSPMFAIQPEVAYVQKHFTVSATGADAFSATENFDYIEIPVLARLGKARGGYIVVGPAFSFLLKAKETADGEEDHDIKDELQSLDYSIVAGGGFTTGKVGIEGRLDFGLRDLNKDDSLGNLTLKERSISVLARFGF